MRSRATVTLAVLALGGCGWNAGSEVETRTGRGHRAAQMAPAGSVARHIALPGQSREGLEGAALLKRGQERYAIFCVVCHGAEGDGDGPAVRHGFPRPPSFREARLRAWPPADVEHVIAHGTGAMYPLGGRIPPADRWAIAWHVRALQERRSEPAR